MKTQIAGIFCFLAGILSVNLFAAPDAHAHGRQANCNGPGVYSGEEIPHLSHLTPKRCYLIHEHVGSASECENSAPGEFCYCHDGLVWFQDLQDFQNGGNDIRCVPDRNQCAADEEFSSVEIPFSRDNRIVTCAPNPYIGLTEEECNDLFYNEGESVHWHPDSGCGSGIALLPDYPIYNPPPLPVEPIDDGLLEPAPNVSVTVGGNIEGPLNRAPNEINDGNNPSGSAEVQLGIQAGGQTPAGTQQLAPQEENSLPEYAAPAALLGALAFYQFYPDYELGSSFNYSGENGSLDWEAGMRGDFHHGSFRSYVSAVQSDNGFTIHSGTTYRSDLFLASYTTVEAKDYMNYNVQLSAPWQHGGWEIKPNLSSEFQYDRDENHSNSNSEAGLDLEYLF